jgi:hypothetical protein
MLTTFLLNGVIFLGGQVFLETFYPAARLLGCSYVVSNEKYSRVYRVCRDFFFANMCKK